MTYDEYCNKRIREIQRFRAMWEREHKDNPKNYPESMNDVDWYDQELAWNNVQESYS